MCRFLIVTAMAALVGVVARCSQNQCTPSEFSCPSTGVSVTSSCGDLASSKSTCGGWSCDGTGTECGMQPIVAGTCDVSLVLKDGASHTVNLVFTESPPPTGPCPSGCGNQYEIAMRVDGILVASGVTDESYNFGTPGCFEIDAGLDSSTDSAMDAPAIDSAMDAPTE